VGRVGLLSLVVVAACSRDTPQPAVVAGTPASADAQHQGITTPHGDHTPHHGGLVLMNGELHYEVVLDPAGTHRLWFSDAVREDLPASIAREVGMTVSRPGEPPETLTLQIDDAGESWVARGRPVSGNDVMVKVSYAVQGAAHDVEIPFVVPANR
jgi:hypothetical protein